jgi:hypothetical protein
MDDCIEWEGYRERKGYGKRGNRYAHRMAWEEAHGPIPDGMCVCHTCDNPPCVNIEHLFLGTHADNMTDMVTKGRSQKGEVNSQARLTEADVRAIRSAPRRPGVYAELMQRFGLSYHHIHRIRSNRRWTHI